MEEKNTNASVDVNTMEAVSQKAMDEAEAAAMRAYHENPDPNVPDFDVETILNSIKEASYVELPIWKKKLEAHLKNLDEVKASLDQYPAYLKYIEAIKNGDDENAKLQAQQELELFNALQNQGITMEMQINSFSVKYDVNKKFLEDTIAMLNDRIETEYAEVAKMTTSQKTEMMYKVLVKQYNEIKALEETNVKNAEFFMGEMLKAYMQRNTIDWINTALSMGHKPSTIKSLYINFKKGNELEKYIMEALRITKIMNISNIDEEKYMFFMFYLAYIAQLSNKSKTPNIKLRVFKENITLMLQNLEDIGNGLYDLKDIEPSVNEEGIEYTWAPINVEAEAFEDSKKMAGVIYLNRLKAAIETIHGMAFDK